MRGRGPSGAPGLLDLAQAVQALGLASAVEVAERYVAGAQEVLARRATWAPAAPAWLWAPAVPAWPWADGPSGAAADGDADPVGGAEAGLRLPATAPGGTATGAVWVHNGTTETVDVQVRAGLLSAADGTSLPPDALEVGAPDVTPLPPGGSAHVGLRVRVPPGTAPGHLHALVTSTAAPDQALVLSLEVLAPGAWP